MNRIALVFALLASGGAAPLSAQTTAATGERSVSMGYPARWQPYVSGMFGTSSFNSDANLRYIGSIGMYRGVIIPLAGVGVTGEAYAGSLGDGFDWGGRMGLAIQPFWLAGGIDWRVGDNSPAFIMSLIPPVRRGGIVGGGSRLRIDWIPSRNQMFNFGVTVPVFQPWAGKTRPRATGVDLPKPTTKAKRAADATAAAPYLAEMSKVTDFLIVAFDAFYSPRENSMGAALDSQRVVATRFATAAARTDSLRPEGRMMEHEFEIWHDQMGLALGAAVGNAELGPELARLAREALLDSVLIPYDATFGQHKERDRLDGLGDAGRAAFSASLPPSLDAAQRQAAGDVFRSIVSIVDAHREELRRRNGRDTRFNWLYLELGLVHEDRDGQAEVDRIIERLTDRKFSDGNAALLHTGPQFQMELRDQVLSAREYHVLWVHDYKGLSTIGYPDTVSVRQTVNYLRALRNAAARYDSTGTFPSYLIFLDQHYFDLNDSRMFMTLLRNPLGQSVPHLPAQFRGLQDSLQIMQDSLREAVNASRRLQEGLRLHGSGWLQNQVRVQVSITQPSDFTFQSSRIMQIMPFVPDNMMRDHRKITFFDLSEDDPSRGRVALAGVGVGETYVSPTWDDRIMIIQGPAALSLKEDARALLKQNGFRDEQIPVPLRARAFAPDYEAKLAAMKAEGFDAHAMVLHNEVGFGPKKASVAQMAMLTLAQPGSLVVIPDPIWTDRTWVNYLVQASLRGADVLLIAPAWDHAPSQNLLTQALVWDVFSRLFAVQQAYKEEFRRAGGGFRVGFYTREAGINDAAARFHQVAKTYLEQGWLRDKMRLAQPAYDLIQQAEAMTRARGNVARALVGDTLDRQPKLHYKSQLFVTRHSLDALHAEPGFDRALGRQTVSALEIWFDPDNIGLPGQQRTADARAVVDAWDDLPKAVLDSSVAWYTVGSKNMDTRGQVMDAEMNGFLSGSWALQGYVDMLLVAGLTSWPETQEEVNKLFPPFSEGQRRRGYLVRKAI